MNSSFHKGPARKSSEILRVFNIMPYFFNGQALIMKPFKPMSVRRIRSLSYSSCRYCFAWRSSLRATLHSLRAFDGTTISMPFSFA